MSAPSKASGAVATGPPRQPLSSDRIVSTALRFIDDNRLTDLSMRRLGAELGVEAMSLYRYFPSKAALLDAAVCQVLRGVALPDGTEGDWEGAVRAYARSFREVARHHPNLFPFVATSGEANATLRHVSQRMHDVWIRAGLDERRASQAQATVEGYVTGANLRDAGGAVVTDDDFEFGLETLLMGLQARLFR